MPKRARISIMKSRRLRASRTALVATAMIASGLVRATIGISSESAWKAVRRAAPEISPVRKMASPTRGIRLARSTTSRRPPRRTSATSAWKELEPRSRAAMRILGEIVRALRRWVICKFVTTYPQAGDAGFPQGGWTYKAQPESTRCVTVTRGVERAGGGYSEADSMASELELNERAETFFDRLLRPLVWPIARLTRPWARRRLRRLEEAREVFRAWRERRGVAQISDHEFAGTIAGGREVTIIASRPEVEASIFVSGIDPPEPAMTAAHSLPQFMRLLGLSDESPLGRIQVRWLAITGATLQIDVRRLERAEQWDALVDGAIAIIESFNRRGGPATERRSGPGSSSS